MPAMPRPGLLPAHASVVPLPVAAVVCGGDRAARHRRALRRARRNCAALVDGGRDGSIAQRCWRVFTLGIPLAAALMSLPLWFYWTGHPDARHVADPARFPRPWVSAPPSSSAGWCIARATRCRHAASRAALAGVPAASASIATGLAAATSCTVQPIAQPGLTKIPVRLRLRRGGVGLGARPHGRRAALPV